MEKEVTTSIKQNQMKKARKKNRKDSEFRKVQLEVSVFAWHHVFLSVVSNGFSFQICCCCCCTLFECLVFHFMWTKGNANSFEWIPECRVFCV